jgi:hypothetical protein
MAWFDPPLYNPGNKKCPSCGNPVGWTAMWWWAYGSSTYLCSRCGSELRVAIGRSILGWALSAAYYALWLWVLTSGPEWAGLPFMYGGILLLVFTLWWFTSVGLSERVPLEQRAGFDPPFYKPGNKRCPNCGRPARQMPKGFPWATWYCTQCGSALRHDASRRIMGLVLTVVLAVALCAVCIWSIFDEALFPRWVQPLLFFYCIPLIVFNQWWFVSIKLDEKAVPKSAGS